ncbi:MAG TPA: septum formation initiator family protein [Desulfobacterales bacterium]|mgnify:FL=1|nr:septum formation initiator family protein [Desulfobacterales bacterium]
MSKRQKVVLSFLIPALFLLLLQIIYGDKGLVDLNHLKKENDCMAEKNEEIHRQNLSLYREIERLEHDPEFIESVARYELGMIGKDELIFKVNKSKAGTHDERRK